MKKAEFDFVVRHIVEQLVTFIMEDEGVSLPEAFDRVYNSPLYRSLQDCKTGLYRYSPAYIYKKFKE